MRIAIYAAATAALTLGMAATAAAAPVTLTGNFVNAGISDSGTLGSNGVTPPGLQHDPTGTGTFGIDDYLTPGIPHDGFSVNSLQSGFGSNDNVVGAQFFTTVAGPATLGGAFDNMAEWTGENDFLRITNLYFFNDGDERINVTTTLTAKQDLTNLSFARSTDPDPDVNTFGSFSTNNQRGNGLFGPTDFVGSAGAMTGLTLGLLNLSGDLYTHNTLIGGTCCSNINPVTVLGGSGNANGDFSINMAWLIGDLASGGSATIRYAYVVGDNIETVGGGIPEPATWAMMIMGFGFAGVTIRRRRMSVAL